MSVTQQQIADRARVSIALVNFVLNGRAEEKKVNLRTAQRVVKAAKELGYRGNYLAQALSRGRSFTVGLALAGSMQNRMWGAIASGAEAYARGRSNNVLLIGASDGEGAVERGLRFMDEKRIDALVVSGSTRGAVWARGDWASRRAVFIGPQAPPDCASVWVDPAPGIGAAVEHLHGLGHRRILYIGKRGKQGIEQRERVAAYRSAAEFRKMDAREFYIPAEGAYFEELERHIAHVHGHLSASWRLEPGVTAVLCYNDTLALALYAVLQERGIRIPRDVSVVGFDDLHAGHAFPALTTVSHMFRELGSQAMAAALGLVEGRTPHEARQVLAAQLVVRASTGPVG